MALAQKFEYNLDLEFEQNVVTRFLFDDQGKVLARGDLSEERLVKSQLGFSLTR